MNIITWIILGLLAGVIAKSIYPGYQGGGGGRGSSGITYQGRGGGHPGHGR